ncbi:MAG: hypothetical protein P1U39_00765 [Legionellaceae bacterium]|nr:hypothetical protein [Legionellaceae bacterium]
MAWFEREERLKNLSPQHKEVWTNAYHGKLGIESGAFEKLVTDYLDKQDQIDPATLSDEQKVTYKNLENLKTALRAELKTFTETVKALPSNTLAEALANEATEEKTLIIEKLKLLNQHTQAFTKSLPDTKTAGTADTAHPATPTPGATTGTRTGTGTGTGRASSPWTGAHAGTRTGSGTGTDTRSDEEASLDTPVDADSDVESSRSASPKTVASDTILGRAAAAATLDNVTEMEKNLGKEADDTPDPELAELEKKLTGAITDMHRAAQIERDRIPLLAVLTANKRKLNLFSSTIDNLSEHGISALWSQQKASPPSVLVTGDDQAGVEKLRHAMRKLDLSGQKEKKLKEAKENLEKTEKRLKKAEEDNDQDKIDQYKKEKEKYEADIKEHSQQLSPEQIQEVAKELQGNAGFFLGLVGYNPGLTALSGRKINVVAADQGLSFQMNFPIPLFSPGYYLSREHNTKADLVSMADLIKQTGAKNIYFNIDCRDPEMRQRLKQEAYEAALEVGDFDSITINGEKITKDNMHEKLYQDLDPQSKQDTGKYQRKEQLAKDLKKAADNRRAEVKQAQAQEATKQQTAFKHTMHETRTALDKAAQNIKDDTPTPPSDEPGTSATLFQ